MKCYINIKILLYICRELKHTYMSITEIVELIKPVILDSRTGNFDGKGFCTDSGEIYKSIHITNNSLFCQFSITQSVIEEGTTPEGFSTHKIINQSIEIIDFALFDVFGNDIKLFTNKQLENELNK